MTEGPFAESKEIVGGYALIDAASKTEAFDFAQRFVEIQALAGVRGRVRGAST